MPDWNPAEIIGVRPRPLALSLYREIITDAIWAYQRHNYGYKNLRSFPLLQDFEGLPRRQGRSEALAATRFQAARCHVKACRGRVCVPAAGQDD